MNEERKCEYEPEEENGYAINVMKRRQTVQEEPKETPAAPVRSKNYEADATIHMPKAALAYLMGGNLEQLNAIAEIEGDTEIFSKLREHMVSVEFFFDIVEP